MQKNKRPTEIKWAMFTLFTHVALHLFVPLLMENQRDMFIAQFQRMSPDQSLSQVTATVNTLLVAGLIYHLIFGMLFTWLALKIRTGRNWARILVSIVLVFGIVGTFFSFSSPTPMPALYKTLNITSWLLAFATLGLLWLPGNAQAYFGIKPHTSVDP